MESLIGKSVPVVVPADIETDREIELVIHTKM